MGIPGYDGLIFRLDDSRIAADRTELDINTGPFSITSVDWATAGVQASMTQDGDYGNDAVTANFPNIVVTVTLSVGSVDGQISDADALQARRDLGNKIGLWQREGGFIGRQEAGRDPLYGTVTKNVSMLFPDQWFETTKVEAGVVLTLECKPVFFGDEIQLDALTCTGYCAGVLTDGGDPAVIEGDMAAITRIEVADTSGNAQNGLIFALRSRHYDSASTAAVVYEAEDLTPLNGAAIAALSGASGGHVIKLAVPTPGIWTPILATNLLAGSRLTHLGTYGIKCRAYSATERVQLRLVYGDGQLAVPSTNAAVQLPGIGDFYELDLGVVRLEAQAAGANEWTGVIQAMVSAATDDIQIDQIFLESLDEAAGQLAAIQTPPSSVAAASNTAGAGADDAAVGSIAWTDASNIATGGAASVIITPGATSHFLDATGFDFAIPSGATITGITATITRSATTRGGFERLADSTVKLLKAGTAVGANHASTTPWEPTAATVQYGGSADLWGTTWTPAQINASNFGIAISTLNAFAGTLTGTVSGFVTITVYYTLASGFAVPNDAVIYASQSAEIGTNGMSRTQDGTVYGPVSNTKGNLPRLPPSGIEGRPVELFIKPSRGDFDQLPDSGIDTFTVTPYYRPCYLTRI